MFGNKIDNLIKLKENGINVPDLWIFGKDEISNLPKGLYAVRSSSNVEDGENISFAGQFETYLNVKNEDILDKIELCEQSLNSDSVREYIKENNVKIDNLEMNVMIQKMVNADISGVLFSCNPMGLLNEFVFSVAEGLGENVVQDKVNSVNYYYNITDDNYYFEGGNDLLGKENVIKLVQLVKDIQRILNFEFVDIEFAIEKNEIFVLQARKITTVNTDNILIMDNSNIVESYPNVSLPLTISFVESVYSSIFENVCYRVLKSKKLLKQYNSLYSNMVGNCNGRMYYKISNWYSLIKFLPLSNKIIPIWQEMLGVKNKEYIGEKIKISFFVQLRTKINFIRELLKVNKNMSKLTNIFIGIEQYFNDKFYDKISNKEVLELYDIIERDLLKYWDITLINDMYSFIFTGLTKSVLSKNSSISDVNEYIAGISNIESLKPIRSLVSLVLDKSSIEEEFFDILKKDFINLYGDRSVEELKLETKTFRTNPELLDSKIEEYLQNKERLLDLKRSFISKVELDTSNLKWIEKKLLKHCIMGIRNREMSRLNRTRIYGMVRSMMLKIGENFYNDNKIEDIRDIFYLNLGEIFDVINEKVDLNLKDIVNERKIIYDGYKQLPVYSRLIFAGKEFDKRVINIDIDNVIDRKDIYIGVPCSSGSITGEVVIVNDVNDIEKYKDKILVTKMTDPGWVYLIAVSKGIISEKGSLLSHTAIVSRELKIPFITSVSNAVNIFKNGDIVSLNGNNGEIKIIERVSV